jgi:pimeloyl-ACP methyl ester carboxylesterase
MLKKAFQVFLWLVTGFVILLVIVFASLYRADIPVEKIESKYFTSQSSYVTVQDARLHIRTRGQGPVVFLVHGSFASLHTWDGCEEILSKQFTTISMDLPGHGLTGPNQNGLYTTDYYAELLFALADSLKIEQFSVAGNSMGGQVAWKMALQEPERIEKLVLVDAAGFWNVSSPSENKKTNRPLIFRILSNPVLANLLVKCTPRFLFKLNMEQVYGDPARITEAQIDRYYELMLREGNRTATITRLQQRGKDNISEINTLSIPTLILWGENDTWIPVQHGKLFHQAIHGSKLILLHGLGHIPMEEDPELTSKLTLNHLQ